MWEDFWVSLWSQGFLSLPQSHVQSPTISIKNTMRAKLGEGPGASWVDGHTLGGNQQREEAKRKENWTWTLRSLLFPNLPWVFMILVTLGPRP